MIISKFFFIYYKRLLISGYLRGMFFFFDFFSRVKVRVLGLSLLRCYYRKLSYS